MINLWNWLEGKKSYIGIIAAAIYQVGILAGWWMVDGYVWTVIFAWLGISARSAVTKISV